MSGTNAHAILEGVPKGGAPAVEGGRAGEATLFFSGHGSQWAGMGRTLMLAAPVFRERFLAATRLAERFGMLKTIGSSRPGGLSKYSANFVRKKRACDRTMLSSPA